MSILTVSGDVTKRRAKLARQLEKLGGRREKVTSDLAATTQAWESALEAGADTTRHTARRRELSTELDDLTAEAERLGGWVAEIDEQLAEAERRAQLEHDFAAEAERYATDVARMAELTMYTPQWREAAAEVLRIAQRVAARTREAARIEEELPGRCEHVRVLAEQLGVDWSPPAAPGPPADLERPSLPLSRAMFAAANKDVAATAEELGKAAGWEIGT